MALGLAGPIAHHPSLKPRPQELGVSTTANASGLYTPANGLAALLQIGFTLESIDITQVHAPGLSPTMYDTAWVMLAGAPTGAAHHRAHGHAAQKQSRSGAG